MFDMFDDGEIYKKKHLFIYSLVHFQITFAAVFVNTLLDHLGVGHEEKMPRQDEEEERVDQSVVLHLNE